MRADQPQQLMPAPWTDPRWILSREKLLKPIVKITFIKPKLYLKRLST